MSTVVPGPYWITVGPDGTLWVSLRFADVVIQGDLNGTLLGGPFSLGGGNNPTGSTIGPDGSMWFAEFSGNAIGRVGTGLTGPVPPLATTCVPPPAPAAPVVAPIVAKFTG